MIDFSIKNHFVVNLVIILIVFFGILSWYSMPSELFPVVEKDSISITTLYDGATPEEVEKEVTIPIEDSLDGLLDVDYHYSRSEEGVSQITIKLKPEADVDDLLRNVKDLVDGLEDFPDEADKPMITRIKTRFPVISVSIFGDNSQSSLFFYAKDLKQNFMTLDGVTSVGIAGNRDEEVWVIIDPTIISIKNISMKEIIHALKSNIRDLPGGSVKAIEGNILLRGIGSSSIEAIENITLKNNEIGGQLLLKEVALIEKRLEEESSIGRFNGKKAVNMTITKTSKASIFQVAEDVKNTVNNYSIPPGIKVTVFSDFSLNVGERLDLIKASGILGIILLFITLTLFLNKKVAYINSFGVPIAFLFASFGMYIFGYTINMVSLFAFLIALGLIVDDSIIVTENTYRHIENGMDPVIAASIGAKEVFWPIMASVTTTIVAFLPILSITGTLGKFVEVIPVVVSIALLGSLLEAFFVLPGHCARYLKKAEVHDTKKEKWNAVLSLYEKYLRVTINNKYLAVSFATGIFFIMIAFAVTRMPYNQFEEVESGQFFINAETSITSSVQDSEKVAIKMEKIILDELKENELMSLYTNIGLSFKDLNRFDKGSQYIQIIVSLKKSKPKGIIDYVFVPIFNFSFSSFGERERSENEITDILRERLSSISNIQKLSVSRPAGGPGGADIVIGITGQDQNKLKKYSEEVEEFLSKIYGVKDAEHDQDPGKTEFKYTINNRGKELGLTQADIAESVRTGFLGLETAYINLLGERTPVRLIYSEEYRKDSSKIYQLPIVLKSGMTVYLSEIADLEVSRSLNTIGRRDGKRLSIIKANVDSNIITPNEVTALFDKKYKAIFEKDKSFDYEYFGEKKRSNEDFENMKKSGYIALIMIFFILGLLFKTILEPFVVMLSIPFGIVGVIFGHIIFGYNFQFLSLIGLLALSGIVVNDSLLLVDYIQKLRKEGICKIEAVVKAGVARARPIIMTSLTTFVAVSPLIFFSTGQTKFLSPMAVSLGFGILIATVLILLIIPCFYLLADDLRELIYKKLKT